MDTNPYPNSPPRTLIYTNPHNPSKGIERRFTCQMAGKHSARYTTQEPEHRELRNAASQEPPLGDNIILNKQKYFH